MVNMNSDVNTYPQSFQELVKKPQSSTNLNTQPAIKENKTDTFSTGKKVAVGVGITAAAVLMLSTILHKAQPKFFNELLSKEGFGSKIAKGIDKIGEFITNIPSKIMSLFHRKNNNDIAVVNQQNISNNYQSLPSEVLENVPYLIE